MQTTNGAGTAVATVDALDQSVYESLALKGDISGLKPEEKVKYMTRLCESLGLNPYTQPFLPLKLNGKEVLYASKGCTDQLSQIHNLTRDIISTQQLGDVFIATCKAQDRSGRYEISTGVVAIAGLKGESLANALMKAETKAKRRATLSYCGLGFLDESELETIPANRMERVEPPVQPQLPAGQPEEPSAPTISDICKQLKAAGDEVDWNKQTLADYAETLFGNEYKGSLDALTAEQKTFLAEDLGERLKSFRKE
jgi:hypothetical protein